MPRAVVIVADSKPPRRSYLVCTTVVLLLFFGGLVARTAWQDWHRERSLGFTVPVAGTVTRATLGSVWSTRQRSRTLDVRFEYQAGGRTFENGVITFGGLEGDTAIVAREASKYPVGAAVSGWANPSDLAEAVIVRGRVDRLLQPRTDPWWRQSWITAQWLALLGLIVFSYVAARTWWDRVRGR